MDVYACVRVCVYFLEYTFCNTRTNCYVYVHMVRILFTVLIAFRSHTSNLIFNHDNKSNYDNCNLTPYRICTWNGKQCLFRSLVFADTYLHAPNTSHAYVLHINTQTYLVYMRVSRFISICIPVYIYTCIHVYICICVYMGICSCVYMYIYMYVRKYIYKFTFFF